MTGGRVAPLFFADVVFGLVDQPLTHTKREICKLLLQYEVKLTLIDKADSYRHGYDLYSTSRLILALQQQLIYFLTCSSAIKAKKAWAHSTGIVFRPGKWRKN
jgi:hypothetical protein